MTANHGDFLEYHDGSALPSSVTLKVNQAARVESFEMAHALIARGADSARVAIDLHNQRDAWMAAWRAAAPGEPLTPPQPFDFDRRIVIILPMYNERENIEAITRAIGQHLVCDLLIVDDNSPDGTGQRADELASDHGHIHVMHRPGKMGLASAYLDGFRWTLERDYDLAFEMDSDFSHPPHVLPRLAHAAGEADLVLGSRYIGGGGTEDWSFGRTMLSMAGNLYTRLWLGFGIRDWTGGFRCYRTSLLRKMDLSRATSTSYSIQMELAWFARCCGARICEVPFHFADRAAGESKIAGGTVVEALQLVPRLRWRGRSYYGPQS